MLVSSSVGAVICGSMEFSFKSRRKGQLPYLIAMRPLFDFDVLVFGIQLQCSRPDNNIKKHGI